MKSKKGKKRVGLFSCIIDAIKQGIKAYKDKLEEIKMRRQLLSAKTDWGMLEYFIQEINDNPKLKVTITLGDGTKLEVTTMKTKQQEVFNNLEY